MAVEIPENAGPKTRDLAQRLNSLLDDPGNSHEALIYAAITGILPIIGELEAEVASLKSTL
jgi:hypothetical protein